MNLILDNWNKIAYQEWKDFLLTKSDTTYKEFHSGIVPGADSIIGIRMPIQRTIAKEIVKGNWRSFLSICEDEYYEIIMIQGLVIGYIKTAYDDFINLFSNFINKITNWGICDSFCSGLKRVKKNDLFFQELQNCCNSTNPWHIRTGLVTMLFHYIDADHIDEILSTCNGITHTDYYVKMGQAWLLSICYIKQPEITLKYLTGDNQLDTWTFNKAIQKIRESNRVSPESKSYLQKLKRKS